MPVGSNQPKSVDIRVVAATHRVLEDEIKAGRFRADQHTPECCPLQVQPLRSRRDEVPALIRHFAKHFALANSPAIEFSEGSSVMQRYDWPGNAGTVKYGSPPDGAVSWPELANEPCRAINAAGGNG